MQIASRLNNRRVSASDFGHKRRLEDETEGVTYEAGAFLYHFSVCNHSQIVIMFN